MDMISDDETDGFSFNWTIQNFSYCLQKKGEHLSSPRFKLNLSDTNEWCLRLYPRGFEQDNTIGFFLFVLSNGPFPFKVKYCFSIVDNNSFYTTRNENASSIFKEVGGMGHPVFFNYSELYKKGDDGFLENDTLELSCRIWKEHPELPVFGECYARTIINTKTIDFIWTVENFKELLNNGRKTINFHAASSEIQSFTVAIFLCGDIYNEKKIQVEIKQNGPNQKTFLSCKLSLLDADGKIVLYVHDDHLFEASEGTENWHFPFTPLKKILDREELYLVSGTLNMLCKFVVSSGEKYSEVEKTEYGDLEDYCETKCNNEVDTTFLGSLKDNLRTFYNDGKFSDLTVRTASSKEFPVHKAILCARSEVFRAMFEHDTKENRTGVVEIEDLDDDTVSKMLLFTYTDIVEDLVWQTALELYFAADKYGIGVLKRECATFLEENMNSNNVCEVLILADMHQDQELKSSAQDFVMNHATEIINSMYWKKFIKDKSYLAAETMHLLCMRNLEI